MGIAASVTPAQNVKFLSNGFGGLVGILKIPPALSSIAIGTL
jgi:hypothetical protein